MLFRSALAVGGGESTFAERAQSLVGLAVMIGIGLAFSYNRHLVDWQLVSWGVSLQIIFGILVLRTPPGGWFFDKLKDFFNQVLAFTDEGSAFLFGVIVDPIRMGRVMDLPPIQSLTRPEELQAHVQMIQHPSFGVLFAFKILPSIIFFSSLMAVLYYLEIVQKVVYAMAWAMQRTMGTSGAESLSAAANVFVGQTEAPLVVKPFVERMTVSELMALMTGGMATVAGGVLAAYVGMGLNAAHLLTASVMSAPAALLIGKIMVPETEESETKGEVKMDIPQIDANVIDAAARGAGEGLTLAMNVGAMLLAFIALVAMINHGIGIIDGWIDHGMGIEEGSRWKYSLSLLVAAAAMLRYQISSGSSVTRVAVTGALGFVLVILPYWSGALTVFGRGIFPSSLQGLCGYLFAPLAWIMGVPRADMYHIGSLLGMKTVLNEFVAYQQLGDMMAAGSGIVLDKRSIIIATYALCGFANFGSIAIQIGGIGSIAPSRRQDLARLGMYSLIGGTLAAFMTATVAGLLL